MKPADPLLGTPDLRVQCPAAAGTMAPSAAEVSPPIESPSHRDVTAAMCPPSDVSSLDAVPEAALAPSIEIIEVQVTRHTVDLIDIVTDALGHRFRRIDIAYWSHVVIADDARQPDFRLLLAVTNGGHSVGFAYGYSGAPGQDWYERVVNRMPIAVGRRWLQPPHYMVAELHVRRQYQRHGVGSALLDKLLASQPHTQALLSVDVSNVTAREFYARRAWHVVAVPIHDQAIMAKEL
jgi:ribosomal protein S18 acetylase RimI-like enzyme